MRRPFRHRAASLLAWSALGLVALPLGARAQERPSDLPWMGREPSPPPVYPEIFRSAEALLGAGSVPLDARPREAFLAGHPPGALRPEIDDACIARGVLCVQDRLAGLGLTGTEPAFVYGDDPEAVGRLFWLLEWAGFPEVQVLDGGLGAWRAAGGEVVAGRTPGPERPGPAGATAPLTEAPTEAGVDRAWLLARFGTPAVEVLDLRGAAWEGPEGHVPHSLPYDFRSLLPENGEWPDPPAARRTIGRLGPRRGTYVDLGATFVVYGEGPDDRRSGLGYLLLRAAGLPAAVYVGGWADWRSAEDAPVVRIVDAREVARRIETENPGLAEDRAPADFPVFDVRGEAAHRAEHLPGAVSLPAQHCDERLPEVALEASDGGEGLDAPVAFYCYGRDCIRSRNCSTAAARAGFRNVLWFRDGMPGWYAAGLPVFRSKAPATRR